MTTSKQWEGGRTSRLPSWMPIAAAIATVATVVVVQQTPVDRDTIPIDPPVPAVIESERPTTPVQPLDVALPVVDLSKSDCSFNAPVPIIGGKIYPPTHPDPPGARPEACYSDVGSAQEDRYRLAAAPRGYVEAAGFYLGPVAQIAGVCTDAAATVGHAVACPTKLPRGGALSACKEGCVPGGGFVMHLRGFALPGRWCRRCVSELVIASAPIGGPADALALTRCGQGVPHGSGRDTFRCLRIDTRADYEPHAGHILRRGVRGGVAYAVSIEGLRFDGDEVVDAVFESVTLRGS